MLHNKAKMSVTGTPGTGTITLNAASSGFQTFVASGVKNNETVSYSISDASGTAWEVGRGVYSSAGPTLSRGPLFSSNSNAAISATSAAVVLIAVLAEDIGKFEASAAFPLAADFTTLVNQGSAVFTDTPSGLSLLSNVGNYPDYNYSLLLKPIGGFSFDIYTRWTFGGPTEFGQFGIILRNSSNGRFLAFEFAGTSFAGYYDLQCDRFTDPVTLSANSFFKASSTFGQAFWLRVHVTATVATLYCSHDGYSWRSIGSETFSTFLTAAGGSVDQFGVGTNPPFSAFANNPTLNFFDTAAPV